MPNAHKVIVAPPRINLRRAASYNAQDRGPLSATSSRFNFNHLLFSPPPSPSLPALVPRPKRTPSDLFKHRPSRVLRITIYAVACLASLYFLGSAIKNKGALPEIWPYFAKDEFEMVGQDSLPDFPTPIMIHDSQGVPKWTVSIPQKYDFPLSMQEYKDMSSQCREVSAQARESHGMAPLTELAMMSYDAPDNDFIDVYEAQKLGMLPAAGDTRVYDRGHFVGMDKKDMYGKAVCESSMTYVLESRDAGMGNTLMKLWTFYGLAKEQGRSFFIDDSRWAYGDYANIFRTPPVPTCRPPPRHQIVPCPFQAKHLVVSASTAPEVFPALLAKHHRMAGTNDKGRELWQLARAGYEDLFALVPDDASYVQERVQDLQKKAQTNDIINAPIIGFHVRHGDRHPLEYQYREAYIPGEVYLEAAQQITENHYNQTESDSGDRRAVTVIASDDPMVRKEADFNSALLAQERILLASKDNMQDPNAKPIRKFLKPFTEEAFGWEGGFFAPMFWNLGVVRKNNAANAPTGVEVQDVNEESSFTAPPSEQTLQLRSLVGRAYMMDLAVLSTASDSVVCAVSTMGCRLLGVMMQWEKGVGGEGWVNVDGGFGWTGIAW